MIDVSGVLVAYAREINVNIYAAGSYVNGVWTKGAKTPTTLTGTPIPLTARAIRYLPEGKYTTKDMSFYHNAFPAAMRDGDEIIVDGNMYEVKDISEWQLGEFTVYLCKYVMPD